jgi:Asp-tRNA(Asn)/Glu-tRNA(Gln) amidotransferase A subunit family amidase
LHVGALRHRTQGLPIGVQVVARSWHDHVALALAGHLEAELGGCDAARNDLGTVGS